MGWAEQQQEQLEQVGGRLGKGLAASAKLFRNSNVAVIVLIRSNVGAAYLVTILTRWPGAHRIC